MISNSIYFLRPAENALNVGRKRGTIWDNVYQFSSGARNVGPHRHATRRLRKRSGWGAVPTPWTSAAPTQRQQKLGWKMRNETVGAKPGILNTPWIQLATGVVCMAMIANLQYGWTLFVKPIDAKFHWGKPAIQIAFSIFVFTETWLVPIEAWFVDRYGPRVMIVFGGVLVAAAWIINAFAASLFGLYLGAVVAGAGAGPVYGTCFGT